MNYSITAVLIAFITFATFTSLNELTLANEAGECCSHSYCAKHQIDTMAWWAHLGIGILATLYVLAVIGYEVFKATPYGKPLRAMEALS